MVQSQSLRIIFSQLDPRYRAKNDTFELNADYAITDALTLTSQTGYNKDSLYSTEDYNRFNTAPGYSWSHLHLGLVARWSDRTVSFAIRNWVARARLVGEDVSQEHAWQFSQELRLASNFSGPFNFSVGGNFLHYQTVEDYYVFFNAITLARRILSMAVTFSGIGRLAPTRRTFRSMPRWRIAAVPCRLPIRQRPTARLSDWAVPISIPIR